MYMPTTTTTTFLDTLNSLLPAPKSFHRIAYSDTANLPTYLTPTDPHDFAYDYEAGVLMVKTGGAWTTVDATKTFIFKEYTVNCVPPDPYYGIAYNGIPDIDWPPELHWGAIYVADSWTPILGSNAQTGELAVINELTYMLAMTPAGIKLNWAELDQSPTGSGGFVHENDPTINRPVLVTAVLTNPTLTNALMSDSTIENTLALTTTLDDPTILTGTLTGSTITSPIVSDGTFANPVITYGTITGAEVHDEMSYDATLFTAQITNSTLDTATLNSPALNTATIISSSLDDVIITSATMSDSTVNGSNVNDAVINISSMSNSSIDHTSIDDSTVNGSTINDAIISTSAISFTTITDAPITDSTMTNSAITNTAIDASTVDNSAINNAIISTSALNDSTVADVTIATSTMSGSTISTTSIYNSSLNDSVIDNATITSSTLTYPTVADATITASTMSDSSITTSSMSNSSITTVTIDTSTVSDSTVNGSTLNDAVISTSSISFATITDATISDAIINTTVLNSPELVTPDLGTPTSGDLSNCTFPKATTTALGSVMIDNDTITISGTGVISAAATRVVKELVRNNTGATIFKGQAVYISGSNGTIIQVALAQADLIATSSKTLGIVESDIAVGTSGYVIVHGMLAGLNTLSAGAAGDPIWLSPSSPGGVVYGASAKPVAPNHLVYLGVVSRKHATTGEIFIQVQNGYVIDELQDVLVTSPADGQIITYEASTSLWKNKSLSSQANSWTATQSFAGTAANLATVFTNTSEVVTVSGTAANNTIAFDVTSQAIMFYTVNATGNWTVNFRASSTTALNDVMTVGQSVTVSFLVTQGSTAYFNSAVRIDGTLVTPKYQGATAITSGNANGIDMYTYTIIKTGAATFTVLMSLTNFG